MLSNAHVNRVAVPVLQLLSLFVTIESVASRTIATFQGWDRPCIEAVAVAEMVVVLEPQKMGMMKFRTVVVSVT
jgi:hypothetical protein